MLLLVGRVRARVEMEEGSATSLSSYAYPMCSLSKVLLSVVSLGKYTARHVEREARNAYSNTLKDGKEVTVHGIQSLNNSFKLIAGKKKTYHYSLSPELLLWA